MPNVNEERQNKTILFNIDCTLLNKLYMYIAVGRIELLPQMGLVKVAAECDEVELTGVCKSGANSQ